MGGAVLPPPPSFDLRQNYGGGNEDNGDLLQKVLCTHWFTQCPNPAASHHQPRHLLEMTGHSPASLSQSLLGPLLFLLGPCAHKVFFVPSKSLFPQSCVSSGGSIVRLIVISSRSAYAIPRSAASRAPAPAAGLWWSIPPLETHSKAGLAQNPWHPWWAQGFVWALQASGGYGVWF